MLRNKAQDLCGKKKKPSNVHQLKNKKTLRNIQTNKTESWKKKKEDQNMNYEKQDWINNRKPPSQKSHRPDRSCKFGASLVAQMVKNPPAI